MTASLLPARTWGSCLAWRWTERETCLSRIPPGFRKISADGIITTVAGSGGSCFYGDGGPATSAGFSAWSVAVDSTSDLFVADFDDNRVRKVSPSGIITTVAGGGASLGSSGDGGPATSAALSYPAAVTLDSANNLFVADAGNYRVRKVSPAASSPRWPATACQASLVMAG